MKIVSSGRVLNSKGFYEKKKKRRRFKVILFSILLISVAYLIIFLLRQERFFISGVEISGENIVDRDEMLQITRQLLVGDYQWLLPRANVLIYPSHAIKQSLIKEFPRLKSVDLRLDEQNKLTISIEERVPFALYCPSASLSAQTGNCFFLDKEGLIFASAPSFSRGVYFTYVTDESIENPIGKRFVTAEEFNSLSKFMLGLKGLNIFPLVLMVGENEYDLLLSSDAKILWRRESKLALVQSNLEAFLSTGAIKSQSNFLDRILYLDLRTENKVFYKFR